MRKTILIILFCFAWQLNSAPGRANLCIATPEQINHDAILNAFIQVESGGRHTVVNHLGYTGVLQIGQQMIDEANRIQKRQVFTLSDALDSTMSVKVWYILQNHYNRFYDLRMACKVWNPTASEKYYEKIYKMIEKSN